MRIIIVLLVVQLSLLLSAQAQTEIDGDSNSVVSNVRMAYACDTVQAIRHFFADKRGDARYTTNLGILTAGVGGAVLVPMLSFVHAIGTLFRSSPDPGRVATFSSKLLSPGLGITTLGLINRSRFSKKREEAIVSAYLEGQPLSPAMMRRMRKKYLGAALH